MWQLTLTLCLFGCATLVTGQYFNPSGYRFDNSPDFMGSPYGNGLNGLMGIDDDGLFGRRQYGQPADFAHSHDNFDREKTSDEIISARINPLPHIFNPGLRRGLTGLQHIEARYHQKPAPQRELLRPLLLLTNPSKK
uniref:Secreted protein n=1 Tax=Tetranychus urticae TaxID=32264 RepID=T1KWG4_TETUR